MRASFSEQAASAAPEPKPHGRFCKAFGNGTNSTGQPKDCDCRAAASAPPEGIAALNALVEALRERTWLTPVSADEMNHRDRWLADVIEAARSALSSQLEASQKERDELEARRAKLESAFIEENKLADSLLSQLEKTEAQLEASQRREAARWQPIETAPKDCEVLLYGPTQFGGKGIVQGAWNRGGAMHMEHWMGGIYEPTHWMPLPSPPALAEKDHGQ
jgi:hypothetical protein